MKKSASAKKIAGKRAKAKAVKKVAKKNVGGRPRRASGGASTSSILIRVTNVERAVIERAAQRAGKTLTAFVRDAVLSLSETS
ncbi:MAG: DUF1778 domain-containing protein [Polyangiaceae bacterium]|nr:DUF1778 domain-containing protein [Polyangiaceae bacterium]